MSKYKQLAVNSLLFFINAVATKLITFVLVPLYTAFMSAGEYGLTDMSLTVINLATPLFTLSIAEASVRFIVGDRERAAEYIFISMSITLLSVLIVGMMTPFLDLGVFGGLGNYKGLFIVAYASSAFMNLCGEVARGMGEVRLIPICAGISSLGTLASAVLLIGTLGAGIVGYFISVSFGPLLAVIIYLSFGGLGRLASIGAARLFRADSRQMRSIMLPMLKYAVPLIPNNLFWWLSTGINRFYITGMLGIAVSGMFAAASKIPNLLNTVYSVFQQAWQLSAFQESEKEGLGAFFTNVFRMLQAGLTILCTALCLFAPDIAGILLRGETYAAWPMIGLLLLANLFNVFASFYGTVYSTTMHTGFIMKTTAFGAIACVVVTPILIPILGINGACVASALGQLLVFVMRIIDARKYIAISVGWSYLIPSIVLLVVQAVATSMLISGWRAISVACTACILAIQLRHMYSRLRPSQRNRAASA